MPNSDKPTFGPIIMTRNGKIVFTEEASQSLDLTENTHVKLIADDGCSNCHIVILPDDNDESIKIKKSGLYFYTACSDLLKTFGLYSSAPTIYELIRDAEINGKVVYRLAKIITVKDTKIGKIFQSKDDLRSVIAMLNAKI